MCAHAGASICLSNKIKINGTRIDATRARRSRPHQFVIIHRKHKDARCKSPPAPHANKNCLCQKQRARAHISQIDCRLEIVSHSSIIYLNSLLPGARHVSVCQCLRCFFFLLIVVLLVKLSEHVCKVIVLRGWRRRKCCLSERVYQRDLRTHEEILILLTHVYV